MSPSGDPLDMSGIILTIFVRGPLDDVAYQIPRIYAL